MSKAAQAFFTVVIVGGIACAADNIRKDLHFKVGKHPTISIQNQYGPVTVRPGPPRQVLVTAILHSDKVELDQSKSGSRISLVSHLLAGADERSGAVEYEVQVPPTASLLIHAGMGSVHAEKLHGDIMLEGSNGAMDVIDCGDGHVHVRTLNGPVSLSNVRNGHIEIWSVGGDVAMNDVDGPFVLVNSNSGKIQYAGNFGLGGDYAFTSHTGSIEAVAPAYASIDVLARSDKGAVESDFSFEPKHAPFIVRGANSLSGTLGKAASSVKLFSFSGKIRLKKRPN
jgi:Putative adhesin